MAKAIIVETHFCYALFIKCIINVCFPSLIINNLLAKICFNYTIAKASKPHLKLVRSVLIKNQKFFYSTVKVAYPKFVITQPCFIKISYSDNNTTLSQTLPLSGGGQGGGA